MHLRLFSATAIIFTLSATFLSISELRGGESVETTISRRTADISSAGPDLFEVSLGYNYIRLGDAGPEPESLHGANVSAFINLNPWLAVGGEFMANFGTETHRIFSTDVDVDSQRYVYVFGPRVSVWQNSQFRLFLQALAGGVHAEAEVSAGSFSQTASADAFAMAAGIGADWRLSRHFSWRIIQADYLPTNLDNDWQSNWRLSTGIVFSFGGRN